MSPVISQHLPLHSRYPPRQSHPSLLFNRPRSSHLVHRRHWHRRCSKLWNPHRLSPIRRRRRSTLRAGRRLPLLALVQEGRDIKAARPLYWSWRALRSVCLFLGSHYLGRCADHRIICRFGGLIAFGISNIKSSLATWRILFLIEGCPPIILAICVFFFLPSRPDRSNYITEEERIIVHRRLNADSLGEGDTGIDWNGVKRALTDWKAYVVSIMYSAMNLTLGSVTGFLPTIIKGCVYRCALHLAQALIVAYTFCGIYRLGHTDAAAQLFTVPPYAVAFVTMYLISYFSDRMKLRGPFVAGVFTISIVGWLILLLELTNERVRYFACICIVIGGYNNIPLYVPPVTSCELHRIELTY